MNTYNKTETESLIRRTNRWLLEEKWVEGRKKQMREIKRYKLTAAK